MVDRIVSVTPAASYDLVDLATIKTRLNITDTAQDAFLALAIREASKAVANYCNRNLVVEVVSEMIWPVREPVWGVLRGGVAPLQLTNWPVTALTSVVETIAGTPTTLTQDTDYRLDAAKGQVLRLDPFLYPCRWKANAISVSYSAGFATIPDDVVAAVSELVKMRLYAQGRDPMIRQENVHGVIDTTYWFGSGPSATSGIPSSITGRLDNYRVPVIA